MASPPAPPDKPDKYYRQKDESLVGSFKTGPKQQDGQQRDHDERRHPWFLSGLHWIECGELYYGNAVPAVERCPVEQILCARFLRSFLPARFVDMALKGVPRVRYNSGRQP